MHTTQNFFGQIEFTIIFNINQTNTIVISLKFNADQCIRYMALILSETFSIVNLTNRRRIKTSKTTTIAYEYTEEQRRSIISICW
jgi:hypothetical protein